MEILCGGGMSSEQMYKVALSREAVKYYNKVSTNTAVRLDKCFANLESDPFGGANTKALHGIGGKYRYRITMRNFWHIWNIH